MSDVQPEVTHAPERSRYEIRVDGDVVGFADYREDGERVVFTHTEVDPRRRERGLGSRLAQGALDDVVARGLRIVPVCPFIAAYVADHPEVAGSVDPV